MFVNIIVGIIIAALIGVGIAYLSNQGKKVNFPTDARNFTESDIKTKEDLLEIVKKVNNLESVKITGKEIYPEEKIRNRVLISGNKERRDVVDEESGNIVTEIKDFDKMKSYYYHPEIAVARKKELVKENSLFFIYGGIPEFFESEDFTILGEDTINGEECIVFESSIMDSRGEGLEKSRNWLSKDTGIIIKSETLTRDRERRIRVTKVEFVDIPDEMFRLPENVHIVDETE